VSTHRAFLCVGLTLRKAALPAASYRRRAPRLVSLRMLPLTREQFLAVFAAYNDGVWPAQVVAYGGVAVVALLCRSGRHDRWLAAGLALMWGWTGVVYHAWYFARINTLAFVFGTLFAAQAALLVWKGVVRAQLAFVGSSPIRGWLGVALIAYAAVAYPLLGMAAGDAYPELPMFGITPCPVTLFTWGVFLLASGSPPISLLSIPFLWSLIGGSAALLLGVPQDWLLLASSLVPVTLRGAGVRARQDGAGELRHQRSQCVATMAG
jgi:hypothetical protein